MTFKNPLIVGINPNLHSYMRDTDTIMDKVGFNTGNLVFTEAIDLHFERTANYVSRSSFNQVTAEKGDVAVIPCANHLGNNEDLGHFVKAFRETKIPMVAIGLGSQDHHESKRMRINRGTLEWVNTIVGHAPSPHTPNISVRGPDTFELLSLYGLERHTKILGCPSLFINPSPTLGRQIAQKASLYNMKPKRIAVLSGDFRRIDLIQIERSLFELSLEQGGAYIAQATHDLIRLFRNEHVDFDDSFLKSIKRCIAPKMDKNDFLSSIQRVGEVFFNVDAWMEFYRRFDLVIGTRFHGIALAIQAGTPAICIAHDSRTKELCEVMRIPHIKSTSVPNVLKRADIPHLFEFDPLLFDNNRKVLLDEYNQFLVSNHLKPVSFF